MNGRRAPFLLVAVSTLVGCFDPDGGSLDTEASTGAATTTTPTTDGMMTTVGGGTEPTGSSIDTTADASDSASTTGPDDPDGTASSDGGSTDSPSSSSSESGVGTTQGPDPFCGDGRVNNDEQCDDMVNAGAVVGDCAPDCSKEVEARIIRLSQNTVAANFSIGNANFIAEADTHCPAGYAALMTDGTNRVASLAPLMGNGQVDWPIATWTNYVNAAGDTIWTTTDLRLLGVADDNTWVGLDNPVSTIGDAVFTAIYNDYTTADLNCIGFTTNTGASGANRVSFGIASATNQAAIGNAPDMGGGCAFDRYLYCVEL